MFFPSLTKSFIFITALLCLLSITVHAKIENQEEEGQDYVESPAEQAGEKPEGNMKDFDAIFQDPEIAELLKGDFDIDKLLKVLEKKGIELPSAPPANDEDSSIYRHSDLSHGSEENLSDDKSEV
jgi:hypothetical protein